MNKFLGSLKYVICGALLFTLLMSSTASASSAVVSNYPNATQTAASENGYRCDVTGTGVRFRSSPHIYTNNIIRTFAYNETVWVYLSGMNVAYNDGYWWSYVLDKYGTWGYVASKYIATTSGGAHDSIDS